jgi:hypothetical protein
MSSDQGAINDATRYLNDLTANTLKPEPVTAPAIDMSGLTPEVLAALGNLTGKA